MNIKVLIKKLYIRFTGYSYTNLGRLFLRLFVSIMLLQFGVRQIATFGTLAPDFPGVLGMSPGASLMVLICIEVGSSFFIMLGFLTRLMSIPPILAMGVAEAWLLTNLPCEGGFWQYTWEWPVFLPIMFMGVYCFILLVGPGKISVDYFLSLHLIHSADESEEELEEV